MPKLNKEQRTRHRNWFEEWRSPQRVLLRSGALMRAVGSEVLFTQGGVDFITEAWAAGQFAKLRSADAVRLVPESQPDFELCIGETVTAWELTEADELVRTRGREYSDPQSRADVQKQSLERWIERAGQIPEILRRRSSEKASKRYPSGTRLLIYLNVDEFGVRQSAIEACFVEATAPAKAAFAEVWILWKERAYHIWNQGQEA